MKKLLLFDLDGTIADTIESIRHAVNITMEHYGYPARSYLDVKAAIGNGAKLLIKRSMPDPDADDDEKVSTALSFYNEAYRNTYMEVGGCYDGMHDTLKELKARGYTIAILSNKQDEYVKLISSQIIEEGIVSMSVGQLEGYPTKPDPTVPLLMASELGFAPSDCVFIGDSDVDIKTAKNSGMVGVGCSWGYRAGEILASLGAEYVIDSPRELLDILD